MALSSRAISTRVERLRRVRARMAETGIGALVLSHGADMPWLCGYTASPHERPTLFVVPLEGTPTLVVPRLEAPLVADAGSLFDLVAWDETDDAIGIACSLASSSVASTSCLAISDRAWARHVLALQARMPTVRFVPSSVVVSVLRAVKDPSEVAALRAAARAADQVAAALQGGSVPLAGRTEASVSEELAHLLVAHGHAEVTFSIVATGPNAASPHHVAGDRTIAPGDTVLCDFGGRFANDGDVAYCSDITRTVVAGAPDPKVRDAYAMLQAAHAAAVERTRPGVSAESIDLAARAVLEDAGLGDRFIHRTGHGIGLEGHEDPYIVQGNETVVSPGMTFSIEPGIYVPGEFGMRLEDIVVVTDDGCELLNDADRALVEVEA
jgi:Xaa-Pro aminopeptidase